MTEFTFGNPATISFDEAMRRQAVDILKGLAERLDVCEASRDIDLCIENAFGLARWDKGPWVPGEGYIHEKRLDPISASSSIDTALSLVDLLYPSLVIVMCRCADGSIEIREAWDAEDDRVEVGMCEAAEVGCQY